MDYNQFFADAKLALNNVEKLDEEVSLLEKNKRKAEKALETEKKAIQNSIDQRINKRRHEVESTYDVEIDKCNEHLKKVSAKRAKAKNQGIKEKIAEETYALRDTNRALRSQIKSNFRRDGVPSYCDWDVFYTLFFPQNLLDIISIILAFVLVFVALPFGIWFFMFEKYGAIALVIIYAADILVFGGLVVSVHRSAVAAHQGVLKEAVKLRKLISVNEKEIDNIARSIKNDTSEADYNLSDFDDELARIKQQLADVTMKKNEAVRTFESVTKNIIADEINDNAREKLEEMEKSCSQLAAEYARVDSERKTARTDLSNNYEVYLGKEFMTSERIDALADIINHGTAANISEAIEEYKNRVYNI